MLRIIDYDDLGKRIRISRLNHLISQEKLSELCDISPQHMSNIENGHTKVSLQTLFNICNELNVSMDYILNIEKNNNFNQEEINICLHIIELVKELIHINIK